MLDEVPFQSPVGGMCRIAMFLQIPLRGGNTMEPLEHHRQLVNPD